MVSTMSADLVSLPLLHEPKVSHRSVCLDGLLLLHEPYESYSLCARPKSPRALALKGLATNETTAQSRDCAVAA